MCFKCGAEVENVNRYPTPEMQAAEAALGRPSPYREITTMKCPICDRVHLASTAYARLVLGVGDAYWADARAQYQAGKGQ